MFHPNMLQQSVFGRRRPPSRKLSGLQTREGGDAEKKSQRTARTTTGRVFSSNLTALGMYFAAALRGKAEEQQQQPLTHQVAGHDTKEPRIPAALPQLEQHIIGQ
jgi:hypothetical protein